jgi:hypothetical protein
MKQSTKGTIKPIEWTVDFEWSRCLDHYQLKSHVAGYATEGVRLQAITKSDGGIEAASDRYGRYRPFDLPALFVRFARDTPASAKGILGFCNLFGIPGGPRSDEGQRGIIRYAAVDVLLHEQAMMRRAFSLFEKGDSKALMAAFNSTDGALSARIELHQDEEGRLYWCPVPSDLIQAMWLQFAMYASSGTKLFRCQNCNEPFIVGTHTGRRSTAVYCSNACKVAAFKERHG